MLRDSRLPLILNVVNSTYNLSNFEPHSPYLDDIVKLESDGWKTELTCPILRNDLPKLLLRILGVIKSLIYKLGLVDPQLFVQVNDACKRFVSFAVLCCNCIILGAIKDAVGPIYFNLIMWAILWSFWEIKIKAIIVKKTIWIFIIGRAVNNSSIIKAFRLS